MIINSSSIVFHSSLLDNAVVNVPRRVIGLNCLILVRGEKAHVDRSWLKWQLISKWTASPLYIVAFCALDRIWPHYECASSRMSSNCEVEFLLLKSAINLCASWSTIGMLVIICSAEVGYLRGSLYINFKHLFWIICKCLRCDIAAVAQIGAAYMNIGRIMDL